MEGVAFYTARTALAAAVCIGTAVSTRLYDRTDALAQRKLLLVVLPTICLAGGILGADYVPAPWQVRVVIQHVLWAVSFFVIPFILTRLPRAQMWRLFSVRPEKLRISGIVLLVGWAAVVVARSVYNLYTHALTVEDVLVTWRVTWILLFGTSVTGPILEEWYARGLLWSYMPDRFNTLGKATTIALILTAMHLPWASPDQFIPRDMIGIFLTSTVLGLIRGSVGIQWAMLLHGVHNFAVMTAQVAY